MKQRDSAYRIPENLEPIEMPNNSMVGLLIGALALYLGFALVWHI